MRSLAWPQRYTALMCMASPGVSRLTMILDTTYAVKPETPPPRLAALRAALIGGYANVGPIFA